MNKKFLTIPFEIKSEESEDARYGRFTGKASVYGVVDSYGDVVMPGAFDEWMATEGPEIVILANHDSWEPIGRAVLSDAQDALYVADGRLSLELPEAKHMHVRMRDKLVTGLSIGYQTLDERIGQNGIRQLTKVKLWEVSLVTFPANHFARVDSVKARNLEIEFLAFCQTELKEGRVLSTANVNRLKALRENLVASVGSIDEVLAAADTDKNTEAEEIKADLAGLAALREMFTSFSVTR